MQNTLAHLTPERGCCARPNPDLPLTGCRAEAAAACSQRHWGAAAAALSAGRRS